MKTNTSLTRLFYLSFIFSFLLLLTSCEFLRNLFNGPDTPPPPSTGPISQALLDIAKENAPIVFLHPEDRHHPSSVEWYLNRVELRHGIFRTRNNPRERTERVIAKGILSADNIVGQMHSGENSGDIDKPYEEKITNKSEFFLDIPADTDEEDTRAGSLTDAPCYCHITKQGTNEWQINYLFFYPYNADIVDKNNLPDFLFSDTTTIPIISPFNLGSHEGDWEYFAVAYNSQTNQVDSTFYSAHASEGKWYMPGAYPVDLETNQPKVYVANKSHANYPTVKSHHREIQILSAKIVLPVDETSADGLQWNCKEQLTFLHETQPKWLNYNGRWGRVDDPDLLRFGKPPFGPATKGYW